MTSAEFRRLLQAATKGDHNALEEILQLYMPMINHLSRYDGALDEDCRQYIMIRIALKISEFTI